MVGRSLFSILVLAGLVTACKAHELAGPPLSADHPPAPVSVTSGAVLAHPSDDALIAVTTTRCERELACNKVGQGRPHEDQSSCLEALGQEVEHEIGGEDCPYGVGENALKSCLAAIRQEPCGGRLEQGERLPECRRRALCGR
jgi:hypothetical protein